MNQNWKKLLCAVVAMLMLTACWAGGGETTTPSADIAPETAVPAVTLPEDERVEQWSDPVETIPVQTTQPQVDASEPEADASEPEKETTAPPQEPDSTEPPAQSTTPTEPPAPPETTQPQVGGGGPGDLTYEAYLAMSPAEQQAHYEQFSSLEDYIAWYNGALAEYEENQPSIEVTGSIDIGDFMNP